MNDWTAVSVLPNIELNEPIDGELAALVPRDDARVRALSGAHPNLRMFLGRFKDAFGARLRPAVLLARANAPSTVFTVDAIASFRDAISIAVVTRARAWELAKPRGHRVTYSNAFSFYPWMLDKNHEDLIGNTPAFLGIHDVKAFHGQSSPEISRHTLSAYDIDRPLIDALIARWHVRYGGGKPARWPEIALFRSLNMANQAALIPAGSDTTLYDVGRSIALWVSAFEILAHPGTGKSGLASVYGLLEKVGWQDRRTKARRYCAYAPGGKTGARRSLACRLYGEIYRARNDFLHGNPVFSNRLAVRGSGRGLFECAAPLYRMALTGFLPLAWTAPMPDMNDARAFGRYIADRMVFHDYQKTVEEGLLALRSNAQPIERRQRRAAAAHCPSRT